MSTFLKVIDTVDNYCVDPPREPLVKFLLPASSGKTEVTVGWIREPVLPYIRDASNVFVVSPDGVRFDASLDTFEKRTAAIGRLCLKWRDAGLFSETIGPKKWRNELYPIFYDPLRRTAFGGQEVAFAVERTCCSLFGFGVHMTMYLDSEGERKIWVPTRAKTKQTWGGYLDNTVAGGIPHGMSPTEALIKECMEEASLPENFVRKYIKPVGAVSYFYQNKYGGLQPEVQYTYDLEVPPGIIPPTLEPLDGEVDSFELLALNEVTNKMDKALFKPNCALVIVDFMIRHGCITPESEPNFLSIVARMHGRFGIA